MQGCCVVRSLRSPLFAWRVPPSRLASSHFHHFIHRGSTLCAAPRKKDLRPEGGRDNGREPSFYSSVFSSSPRLAAFAKNT